MQNPADTLVDFLNALPATIKETVLSQCLLAFDKHPMSADEVDLMPFISSILDFHPLVLQGHRCAMLSGVIEVTLADHGLDYEKFYSELSQKHGSETFAIAAAQQPMKVQHFAQARGKFDELRAGPLSAQSLRKWSALQMGNSPQSQ